MVLLETPDMSLADCIDEALKRNVRAETLYRQFSLDYDEYFIS